MGQSGTILRTADGGLSWAKNDGSVESDLTSVRFFSPTIAWAVGDQGIVLRSTDGGQNWRKLDIRTTDDLFDILPVDEQAAIAVSTHGIFETIDGGRWILKENPLRTVLLSLAISKSGSRVAVGSIGGILVSKKDGKWEPKTRGGLGMFTGVHISGEGILIAGNGGELIESSPRESSFHTILRQNCFWNQILFSPDGRHGFITAFQGNLLRSDDDGRSWKTMKRTPDADPGLHDGILVDDLHAWLAGDWLWSTNDGGETWKKVEEFGSVQTVSFANRNRGIVGGDFGLKITEDGGKSWQPVHIGTGETLSGLPLQTFYIDEDHLWIVGTNGLVLFSRDGGHNWQSVDTGQNTEFSAVFFLKDRRHGWIVGTNGILGITSDGGDHWRFKQVKQHMLLAVHFRDQYSGMVVGWGGTIIQTTDGGETWSDYEPSMWPSPWYYGSWILVALVAAPAFRRPKPQQAATTTIANKLVSDRPLGSVLKLR